ncbi:winged helix-turn-helix domain-containing protein [Desertivirga arenae]|uniref:winged helix-turn-helix domain-containing protein n=1 Tax=Desertivirga arenae TaxID=2810309 RepID=UPI001A976B6A
MKSISLTQKEARKIILSAAGLSVKGQFGSGKEAVVKILDHLGFLQLDTNYVVERAHHHQLFSRIPDYQNEWLEELCDEGLIYEYFFSDAGYLPMNDFRYSLAVKNAFKSHGKPFTNPQENLRQRIMDQIERDGPVMVEDFENDRTEASTGWWDWRPSKIVLEKVYLYGDLMIRRNKAFKKIYDLPSNLISPDTDMAIPGNEEFAGYIIERTLRALGIASVKEMKWRARRVKDNLVTKVLDEMVTAGKVNQVTVEGVKGPLFILASQEMEIELANGVFILSPFDILNVFRSRLMNFFNFDYQIECFVPAPKRKYGYFSLPILAGDTFIARMDAKADRKSKTLIVNNLHFEPVELDHLVLEKFIASLKSFVLFNKCQDISFTKTNNKEYLKNIVKGFS